MVLSDKMAIKELKSIDLSSYTIISTGVATLISILIAIIIIVAFAVSVPNSMGVMIYIFPTIVFGTMIINIFVNFSTGYLYNVLSKRLGFVKEYDGIYEMTLKGAFYYHYYENFYTLSYIDKMWGIMRKESFPKEIKF